MTDSRRWKEGRSEGGLDRSGGKDGL